MRVLLATIAIAVGLCCSPVATQAQPKSDVGKEEFESKCASCHGLSGKGDGPLSGIYMTKTTDLTTLAKRNGGVFPVQRAHEIIDGRHEVAAHGPRAMPVWGSDYRTQVPDVQIAQADRYYDLRNAVAEAKMLALIDYLFRIQEKK